jgi:hypothetical protein
VLSPWQQQALIEAGLVKPENGKDVRRRGEKKKAFDVSVLASLA